MLWVEGRLGEDRVIWIWSFFPTSRSRSINLRKRLVTPSSRIYPGTPKHIAAPHRCSENRASTSAPTTLLQSSPQPASTKFTPKTRHISQPPTSRSRNLRSCQIGSASCLKRSAPHFHPLARSLAWSPQRS